jgi:hypothetical protein
LSRVKNVSGGPLDVPLLDRVVEADEVVEVPDFQADGESPIVWPPDKWEPVATPKVAAEAKRAPAPVTAAPAPEPAPPDQTAPPPAPVSTDPRERR